MEFLNVPHFENTRVLIYGDVMLDQYWYGDTARISPEAPVPVVKVQDNELRPGGAANVAVNVAALGGQVTLLGCIGTDQAGKDLLDLLQTAGVNCRFQSYEALPTVTKLRVIGRNQQLIRMDFEQNFGAVDHHDQLSAYAAQLATAQVVILSDYAKGTLLDMPRLIQMAVDQQVPVLVDPKDQDISRYRGASLLTPNLKEFEAMVGPCHDRERIIDKALQLIHDIDLRGMLVTLGGDGMLLVLHDETAVHMPTHARQVYDVTGAGDTVIAVLAASMAAGAPWTKAARLANVAAGIVVGKLGAEVVSPAELYAATTPDADSLNILTESALLDRVTSAKQRGERVVMTNGCFDLLHAGHVQYLAQAKALGDRLIVAVNDDASVRALKGDSRPLNTLQERMAVLAGLKSVDWVVPFSEDTPARLIAAVLPHVLVKGGDYQVTEIAGHETVLAAGGRVEILPFKPGCSTTGLVNRILDTTSI